MYYKRIKIISHVITLAYIIRKNLFNSHVIFLNNQIVVYLNKININLRI